MNTAHTVDINININFPGLLPLVSAGIAQLSRQLTNLGVQMSTESDQVKQGVTDLAQTVADLATGFNNAVGPLTSVISDISTLEEKLADAIANSGQFTPDELQAMLKQVTDSKSTLGTMAGSLAQLAQAAAAADLTVNPVTPPPAAPVAPTVG